MSSAIAPARQAGIQVQSLMVSSAPTHTPHHGLLGGVSSDLVLRVCGGEHDGRVLRLRSPKCTIGSGANCTLRLRSTGILPIHCLILRGLNGAVIRRWSPGTLLNGGAFVDAPLHAGDRISVGHFEMEVLEAMAAESNPPPSQVPSADEHIARLESRIAELEEPIAAADDHAPRTIAFDEVGAAAKAEADDRVERERAAAVEKAIAGVRQELEQQLAQAREEFDRAREAWQQADVTRAELAERCASADADCRQLRAELVEERRQSEALRDELRQANENATHAANRLEQFGGGRLELERQRDEFRAELESQRQTWDVQRQELETELSRAQSLADTLQRRCAELESQRQVFLEQEDTRKTQIRELRSELDGARNSTSAAADLTAKLQTVEHEASKWRDQADWWRRRAEQLEVGAKQRQRAEAESPDELTHERAEFAKQRVAWNEERERLAAEIERGRCELAELRESAERQQHELRGELETRLSAEQDELKRREQQFAANSDRLRLEHEAAEAECARRQQEIDSRQAELAEQRDTLEQRLASIEQLRAELEQERETLALQRAELETGRQNFAQQSDGLQQERQRLQQQRAEFGARSSRIEQERKELDRQREELASRQAGLESQQAAERAAKARLEEFEASVEQERITWEEQRLRFEVELAEKSSQAEQLRQRADELERLTSELLRQIDEQAEHAGQAADASRAAHEEELRTWQERCARLEAELEAQRTRLMDDRQEDDAKRATNLAAGQKLPVAEANPLHDEAWDVTPPLPNDPPLQAPSVTMRLSELSYGLDGLDRQDGSSAPANVNSFAGQNVGDWDRCHDVVDGPSNENTAGIDEARFESRSAESPVSARNVLSQFGDVTADEENSADADSPSHFAERDEALSSTAQPPANSFVSASSTQSAAQPAEEEEESIEDYMARLLKRVRGEEPSPSPLGGVQQVYSPPPSPAITPKPQERPKEVKQAPESTNTAESSEPQAYVRRTQAPESTSNMKKMRELANESARTAIDQSTRKRGARVFGKLVLAALAAAIGVVLLLLGTTYGGLAYYGGAGAAFVLTTLFAVRALIEARRFRAASHKPAMSTSTATVSNTPAAAAPNPPSAARALNAQGNNDTTAGVE
jgi:hypothetical protein